MLDRLRPLRLLSVTAAAAALAACATANEAGTGSGTDGVTDTSIKVGGIVIKTSASGFSTAEAELGAKARFERANAEGGIHGRKIEFVGAEDDGMVPEKGVTAARKLAQREKVFAVVPVVATAFGGSGVLEQMKVPWFGWLTNTPWCGKETVFGWNGCMNPPPSSKTVGLWWPSLLSRELGGAKGRTVYFQGTDSAASKGGTQYTSKGFAQVGFEVSGISSSVSATAPPQDWAPYVNRALKSANGGAPDVIVSAMSGTKFNTAFYTALRKAGFKGMIADATSYDPKVIADPQSRAALEGVYPNASFAPFESEIPQIATLKADVRKAGAPLSQHTASGYWSADVFLEILKKTGKDLTRDSFLKTANNDFSYSNPGFGQISYPAHKAQHNGCGALLQVRNGKFTVAQPLTCFPPAPAR
jgi:branched-chain amino acid transport system substrate-binding protein